MKLVSRANYHNTYISLFYLTYSKHIDSISILHAGQKRKELLPWELGHKGLHLSSKEFQALSAFFCDLPRKKEMSLFPCSSYQKIVWAWLVTFISGIGVAFRSKNGRFSSRIASLLPSQAPQKVKYFKGMAEQYFWDHSRNLLRAAALKMYIMFHSLNLLLRWQPKRKNILGAVTQPLGNQRLLRNICCAIHATLFKMPKIQIRGA